MEYNSEANSVHSGLASFWHFMVMAPLLYATMTMVFTPNVRPGIVVLSIFWVSVSRWRFGSTRTLLASALSVGILSTGQLDQAAPSAGKG